MKRKSIISILSIMFLAFIAFLTASCGSNKLASPRNMDLVNNTFTWDPVADADGYVVYFNDDLSNRYFIKEASLSLDNKEIASSLISGQDNLLYVRAVKLNSNNLPIAESDRSCIIFDYSRKLATPNKVALKNEKFTWRSVSEAKDYKALVRKNADDKGTLYQMEWQPGTTGNSGTIKDLPDGYLYYVSIVAQAPGFEDSDPSVEVPYDKTTSSVNITSFFLKLGDAQIPMVEQDDKFAAEATYKLGDTVTVVTSKGEAISVTDQITVDGDYKVLVDKSNKVSVYKVTNYYIYINDDSVGKKFSATASAYDIVVTLNNGDKYIIKDDLGNLIQTFTDESVNKGQVYTDGNYTLSITNDKQVKVVSGGEIEAPVSVLGKWPVTFDYNFEKAPAPLVIYADHDKTISTPATPSRYGYIFDGWFEDKYCLIPADFGTKISLFKITAPTTFYAKWVRDENVPINPEDPDDPVTPDDPAGPVDIEAKIYLDVSKFTWFKDANAEINVNILYKDGTNNTFPGTAMKVNEALSADDNLVYEATYFINRGVKSVIFTRNDPTLIPAQGIKTEWDRIEIGELDFNNDKPLYKLQTYSNLDGNIKFTGKWMALGEIDYDDQSDGDDKLYLDFRNVSWFLDLAPKVYAYIWYTDGSENATYPGRELTYTASYTATQYSGYVNYDSERQIAGIIFTRNDSTLPITGEGQGLWNKLELTEADILSFNNSTPAYKIVSMTGNEFVGAWETEDEALKPNEDIPYNPDEPVTPVVDEVQNAYLYLDATSISWFASDNAKINAKVIYADNSTNGLIGMATTDDSGLYKFGYNNEKAISNIEILRLNPETNEVWNIINISMTIDPAKTLYVIEAIDMNTHSGYWQEKGAVITEEKDTIYFYNKDNWEYVYAYSYTIIGEDAKLYLGQWPGTEMEAVADHEGWYKIDVSKSAVNIIFNNALFDDDKAQTDDLEINREKLYYKGIWYATFTDEEAPEPVIEKHFIYYYNSNNWEKVYAYAFTENKQYLGNWPGVEMTLDDGHDGWYKVEVDKNAQVIIFDNGSSGVGNQTENLNIDSTKLYHKNDVWYDTYPSGDEPAPVVEKHTIYFANTENWSNIHAYAFTGTTKAYLGEWPGSVMTQVEDHDGWFKIEVDKKAETIIFNNGEGGASNQTADLDIDSTKLYYKDGWFTDMPSEDIPLVEYQTIYFYNKDNWQNIYAYAFKGTGDEAELYLGTWPGSVMLYVDEKPGWFGIKVNKDATTIIFNDSTGNQTEDLTIDSTKLYYKEGWHEEMPADEPDEPWDGKLTVEISSSILSWGEASFYLYIWYTDNTNNGWPGEVMTSISEGKYEYLTDTSKTIAGVIVIRGNGTDTIWNKTGDINPTGHKISVTAMDEIPSDQRSY